MKKIRCTLCGAEVDNEVYFHCDDCRAKKKQRKTCHHQPDTLEYKTSCRHCSVPLKAVRWEES